MANYTCDEVELSLPALVLGALDQDERAEVLAHLADCEACREKVAEYTRLADGLLLSAPERMPPPSLRNRLLRQIESVPVAPAPAPPLQSPVASTRGGLLDRLLGWLRDRRYASQRAWGLAVAALVVVCGILGAQVVRLSEERALLLRRVNEQQQALVTLVGTNVRVVALNGRPAAANAKGSLRFSPDNTLALFEARDLPPLPPSQSYQLWLVYPDGTRDSGAVFNVPSNGEASLVILAPQPFNAYVRFGVSIEPAGGSPGPTGPPALSSQSS